LETFIISSPREQRLILAQSFRAGWWAKRSRVA